MLSDTNTPHRHNANILNNVNILLKIILNVNYLTYII
jgi:hypothetical protein